MTQYFSANLFSCFRGLLSTGITREIQCSHFKIPLDDDFQLLLRVCSSDTTGALTIR
ncbi:HipA N-terminal domain-containing protein [Chitinophaga sedimenti]|uniref:HipA N-terminal domain-containing protein n=1 Tax=Chitinophaga sedimenti TaxID=2033606 RepID=UPI0035583C8E